MSERREQIQRALQTERTIDITTTGRHTGQPHRIEIWFHNIDDTIYITGLPGSRDWYQNMVAQPDFTFHLKQSIQADLPARAVPITDEAERRAILSRILKTLDREADLDAWVADSPLVRVDLTLPG